MRLMPEDSEIELISNVMRAMANVMRASVTGIRKSAFLNQSLHNIHYRTFLAVINRGKPRSDNNKMPHANAVRKHSPPPEHALKTKPSHPECQRGSKTEPIPIDPTPLPMHPCPKSLSRHKLFGKIPGQIFPKLNVLREALNPLFKWRIFRKLFFMCRSRILLAILS